MQITYEGGERFRLDVRKHNLFVDQPLDAGGDDIGPTPVELFVASLAGCVGVYAERFCHRHGIDPGALTVTCTYEMAKHAPARVERIQMQLDLPAGFPEHLKGRFRRFVDHCTVHNSMRVPPEVAIEISTAEEAA